MKCSDCDKTLNENEGVHYRYGGIRCLLCAAMLSIENASGFLEELKKIEAEK